MRRQTGVARDQRPFEVSLISGMLAQGGNTASDNSMDYENALNDDFGSDSETFEVNVDERSGSDSNLSSRAVSRGHAGAFPHETTQAPRNLRELLAHNNSVSVADRLVQLDTLKTVDARKLSQVLPLVPQIRVEIARYDDTLTIDYMELISSISQQSHSEEYLFLSDLSRLPVIINEEIAMMKRYVSIHYKVVFSELETIVVSPVDYCKVVLEIGQELISIRAHEEQLRKIVSSEKVLTIVMAALQSFSSSFELSNSDLDNIFAACRACIELQLFLSEVSEFVASKLSKFAPNVAAIIGPVATSQLLISTGSLSQLAQTPSCNLPSFGVRDLSSHQRSSSGMVRAPGYLYHCPLVTGLPPEIIKQVLRIISGKVVLAARIDLSKSSMDGSMGQKYRLDVEEKINLLLTPPELTATKALPVPKEQKSKKRAGRRFRKMKERFQMSELHKAQNKMSFGKEEAHMIDGFGEEIGLGLSKSMEGIQVNRNTDARMSKAMISRLHQQKERETFDTIVLSSAGNKRPIESADPGHEWGTMKRQKVKSDDTTT